MRGRFRTLFFTVLLLAALALGHRTAVFPALIGVAMGVYSVRHAVLRGDELAHTFAVVDWLLLGCILALSGGADSWLLGAVPILAMGQLAGTPRREWPYLLAPSLLLLIVLAIADPSLGGNRAGGVAKVAVLLAGGWVAATRIKQPAPRRRRRASVDGTTGFSTAPRLTPWLKAATQEALAGHDPLSVVFLRLQQFEDCRNFLGPQGSEELVRGVARRIERRLSRDDRAFRVRADSFVLALPGRTLSEAREVADGIARDVGTSLIGGRRQTLAFGASSFPTVRHIPDLLAAARDDAQPAATGVQPAPQALPLVAAR